MVGALCLSAPLGCAPEVTQNRNQITTSHRATTEAAQASETHSSDDADRAVERLQTQLALSEAEVRDLRERLSAKTYRRETVRIGGGSHASPSDGWNSAGAVEARSRPMLRLHGPSGVAAVPDGDQEAWELAERLPPLPVSEGSPEPVFTAIAPTAPVRPPSTVDADSPVAKYRAALALLRDRQFGSAVRAFDRFIIDHAAHPYADNALYWKAEALYAQRQYAQSIRVFQLLLRSYPQSGKRPDSLLKLGMSFERLGKVDAARAHYERLLKKHPDSVAAQRAPRRN